MRTDFGSIRHANTKPLKFLNTNIRILSKAFALLIFDKTYVQAKNLNFDGFWTVIMIFSKESFGTIKILMEWFVSRNFCGPFQPFQRSNNVPGGSILGSLRKKKEDFVFVLSSITRFKYYIFLTHVRKWRFNHKILLKSSNI